PYCEADVPGVTAPRARRRRPAAVVEGDLADLNPPKATATAAGVAGTVEEGEEDVEAPPLAASEPATRPRGTGRASHPGGRPRPTS
ncbi:MAG TPA: hypothetical protein VES97_10690, partial [Solirubrobacteraceae bacterium]|nr:hypothetical protein [Solirubrobacteraceae bacterium]